MLNINANRISSKYFLLALAAAVITLTSCEKVIDINLNSAEKRYVVEGVITDQNGARVLISQTRDFHEDNSMVMISGASVEIAENGGAPVTLPETAPGVYELSGFNGSSGNTYSLKVTINGNKFNAVSTMPQKVNLDTIYVTNELLFGDTRGIVNTAFKDPAGRGQYYRFVQYLNGVKEPQIFVQSDEYTDGNYVSNKLFYFPEDDDDDSKKIKPGDHIRIDMFCIDANVYKYWYSLDRSATGGSGQATPSNPVSNLSGGALGYFSAHTTQTKTMVVE